MSSIRDYNVSLDVSDVTSHTAKLPQHETGDLLLVNVGKDTNTGGEFTIPAGWSKISALDVSSSGHRSQTISKIAASSAEPDPVISSTDADTWISCAVSLKHVDQATPVHASAAGSAGGGTRNQMSELITSADNCLLVYFGIGDSGRGLIPDPSSDFVTTLYAEDGNGIGGFMSISYQETAGTCPRPYTLKKQADDESHFIIAINDDGTGDIQPYCDPASPPVEIVHPIIGTRLFSDWSGNWSTGTDGVITAIDGVSVVNANNAIVQLNAGVHLYHDALNLQSLSSQINNWSAARFEFDTARDLSGGIGLVHIGVVLARYAGSLYTLADGGGKAVALIDSSNNWRAWIIAGKDSQPNIQIPVPAIFDLSSTFEVDSSGTLDLTDVKKICFFNLASGNVETTFSMFQLVKTITILGGWSGSPATFKAAYLASRNGLNQLVQGQNNQVDGQYLSFQSIQIGNGTDTTYFSTVGTSLKLPRVANAAERRVQYQVPAGGITIEVLASDNDVMRFESAAIAGEDLWDFSFNALTSLLATYIIRAFLVIGANVTLRPLGFAIGGFTFDECTEIVTNGADLSGGNTISNTQAARAITVTSQADLDKLANCTFSGNGVAMRVDVAGSVSLSADNIKFSGNTVDIEYTGSGTLTFQNGNGSNAVSSSVTGGGTVVIESSVTLTINVNFFGATAPANYEWRLYIDDPTAGIIGTTELAGAENETAMVLTYQYNYSADQTAVLQVIADGFEEPRPVTILLSDADQAVSVNVDADPNL